VFVLNNLSNTFINAQLITQSMAYSDWLDPILSPLLKLDSLVAILLISVIITVIITIVYKYTTDQKKLKALKAEMKAIQKKVKDKKTDPKKAMELNQQAMKLNMEFMKNSFKSTLYTILPIILIFGWLNTHMAYEQLHPDQPFEIKAEFNKFLKGNVSLNSTGDLIFETDQIQELGIEQDEVTWIAKGDVGRYQLTMHLDGVLVHSFPILISEEREYEMPEIPLKDKPAYMITVGNSKIHPFGGFSLFGWHPGWLGTYILMSIILSTGLRKLMKLT